VRARAGTRRCDAVVFDNDGLLLDTEAAWTRAERALFSRHGREFTPEHKRELLGTAPQIAAAKLESMLEAPGQGARLTMELGMLALEEMAVAVEPRPGALALIELLQAEGIPLGVASNSPRMLVERALASAGIAAATFASILTADAVRDPKPAPEIYIASCDALGSSPERTLVLEDSPTGVAAAVAAGCYTVAVPSIPDIDLSAAALVVGSLAAGEIRLVLGL
jgi:HAD superfamily hydrolase (TIGR01509 family)